MLSKKIFYPLQPRGNVEQMNSSAQVDSAFFEAGNVTSSATVPMAATRKTVLKRNAPRTDSPAPTAIA